MKPLIALFFLCGLLLACGQKGPLYLPQPDQPVPGAEPGSSADDASEEDSSENGSAEDQSSPEDED